MTIRATLQCLAAAWRELDAALRRPLSEEDRTVLKTLQGDGLGLPGREWRASRDGGGGDDGGGE